MSSPIPVREADVQRAITDWLSAKRIWWMRMNTGAMSGSHKGKRWFVKFARPGTADLLTVSPDACKCPCITWIEVKRPGGKQSEDQAEFQREVESHGMAYILADSLDDVIEEFEPHYQSRGDISEHWSDGTGNPRSNQT